MSLEQLAALSRQYGADPGYVIAGGGNTSFKNAETLWIKGSGVSLAAITPPGFVAMDRAKLAEIWNISRQGNPAEREAAVLAEMLAARKPGEEQKRPSVETLLHDLLPFAYVVHTHPSLVNGLTCSREGEAAARSLFGDGVLWIPISDPGFVLANAVREKLVNPVPGFFFLQNHGVFVGADTPEGINAVYKTIMDTIKGKIGRVPDFSGAVDEYGASAEAAKTLARLSGGVVNFERNNEIARITESRAAFAPLSSVYNPDQIVYAGSDPLFAEDDLESAWQAHIERTGRPPKIAAVRGVGVFGIGNSGKNAALALELFTDSMKIAAYAESFGGPLFMTPEKIDFINNWEAEQYRGKLVK